MTIFARVWGQDGELSHVFYRGIERHVKFIKGGWRRLYYRMPKLDPGRLPQ